MNNYEKYVNVFVEALEINDTSDIQNLEYQGITEWDSVGHMGLVSELEDAFEIEMETDDIIDFNSFKKGIEVLAKYNVKIEV